MATHLIKHLSCSAFDKNTYAVCIHNPSIPSLPDLKDILKSSKGKFVDKVYKKVLLKDWESVSVKPCSAYYTPISVSFDLVISK